MDYKLQDDELFTITSGDTTVDVFGLKAYIDELMDSIEDALEDI